MPAVADQTIRGFLSQYRALLAIILITISTICSLSVVFLQQEKGELSSIIKLLSEIQVSGEKSVQKIAFNSTE